jgi:hypothetical protein
MIRKLLALPLESVHVLGMAVFFAVGGVLTVLTGPAWRGVASSDSIHVAAQRFMELTSMIGRHGWWLAAAAFVGAIFAPYVRGDGKRLVAWIRAGCAAIALGVVIAAWGAEGSDHFLAEGTARVEQHGTWHSDRRLTPWNLLFLVTAVNLVLAASLVTGGAAKKAKGDGGEKK